jgi:hypothetical protein
MKSGNFDTLDCFPGNEKTLYAIRKLEMKQ